jgi:hypothetical protein
MYNIVADFLSHYPCQSATEVFYYGDLYTINNKDDSFPLSFPIISTKQQNDACPIAISKKRLYHQSPTTLIYYSDKIVLPQSLQQHVINWYHAALLHPGINQTTQMIKLVML